MIIEQFDICVKTPNHTPQSPYYQGFAKYRLDFSGFTLKKFFYSREIRAAELMPIQYSFQSSLPWRMKAESPVCATLYGFLLHTIDRYVLLVYNYGRIDAMGCPSLSMTQNRR